MPKALTNLSILGASCAAVFCLSTLPSAADVASGAAAGTWARGDGNARVRISQCGASLCAVNTWIRNPGSEKVGDKLILTVRKTSGNTFEGTAFDPQRNLNLSSKIVVNGDRMTTSGCLLGGLLCKTAQWTRE